MTWYTNPTIAASLGAVAGAIVTSIVPVFIWQKTKKLRRIDCIINDISSLLSFSDSIQKDLQIIYSNEPANSVLLFNLEIINSGNQAIGLQPVRIRLDGKANIVDYNLKTKPEVGFGEIKELKKKNNELDLEIELLNPQDNVYLEIISINNSSEDIDVFMKNANVTQRVYNRGDGESLLVEILSQGIDPTLAPIIMLSGLPIFGSFGRSLMTALLAQRLEKAVRSKK